MARSVKRRQRPTDQTHGTLDRTDGRPGSRGTAVVWPRRASVYGGAVPAQLRSGPVRPRSPYAVSKLAAEHYCRVFTELYGLETVALRYFNVYGPRQSPNSAYAAAVPLFRQCAPGWTGSHCVR